MIKELVEPSRMGASPNGNWANIHAFNYGAAEQVGSTMNGDLIPSTNSQNKPGRATAYWLTTRDRVQEVCHQLAE